MTNATVESQRAWPVMARACRMLMVVATIGVCAVATRTSHAQSKGKDPKPGATKPAASGTTAASGATGSGSGSGSAAGAGSGSGAIPVEKAGTNESLQNGGGDRPWATGVAQAEQQAALKLFHDGNVQLNDGLFAKAADAYRDALKHWDHPAIHYNMALAQMNLDKPIEAYDNLQAAIKFGESPLQSKDKFDNAKSYLHLLDESLAYVEVTCQKTGAKVSIDGVFAFTAPGKQEQRVKVGKHTFVAELEGHPTGIEAPFVGSGEHFRVELKLYTTAELTRYRRKWDATWMPYAVMGGGVLVGVISGLVELSASNSYRQYDDKIAACNMNNAGCPKSAALDDLRHSGDTKKTIGFVGYGVAGAAIAVGATLAWLNRSEAYQVKPNDLEHPDPVAVTPVVAPGYAGASLQGHF